MKNTRRKPTARMGIFVASVFVLGAHAAVAALACADRATTGLPDPLPPMTLTYEVYGPYVSVGDRSLPDFKEIRHLEYRGRNDWKETVIESPELDLGRYGTASNAGSYYEVRGTTITEYDAMDGSTTTGTRDGSGTEVPNAAFGVIFTPVGFSPLAGTVTIEAVATDVRVCAADGACSDGVSGIKYSNGNRELVVYQGDGYILPVENGDSFALKSVQIHGQ